MMNSDGADDGSGHRKPRAHREENQYGRKQHENAQYRYLAVFYENLKLHRQKIPRDEERRDHYCEFKENLSRLT